MLSPGVTILPPLTSENLLAAIMKNGPLNPCGGLTLAKDSPPSTKCISAEISIVPATPLKESVVIAEPGLPLP